jgi:hypothetical protein
MRAWASSVLALALCVAALALVAGAGRRAEAADRLWIVYCLSNSPQEEWQARLLDFSLRRCGQPGRVLRLVAPSELHPQRPLPSFEGGETLPVEDHARFFGGQLAALQPGGLLELERRRPLPPQDPVLLLETHCLFTRPFVPRVARGRAQAQRWAGYTRDFCLATCAPELRRHCPELEAGAPLLPLAALAADLYAIAGDYMRAFASSPCRWRAERTALATALRMHGVAVETERALCVSGDWPNAEDPACPLVNYRQPVFDARGRRLWSRETHDPAVLVEEDPTEAQNRVGRETLKMLRAFQTEAPPPPQHSRIPRA